MELEKYSGTPLVRSPTGHENLSENLAFQFYGLAVLKELNFFN